MFFCLTSIALTLFSGKVMQLNNVLTLNLFRLFLKLNSILDNFFLIKRRKKFAQTKNYYKFALA